MKTYGLRNIFWDNANEDVFRTQSNIYDGVFSLKKHLALDHVLWGQWNEKLHGMSHRLRIVILVNRKTVYSCILDAVTQKHIQTNCC